MKITKRHVQFSNGFYRFSSGIEFHWSFYNWALLFNVDRGSEVGVFVSFLFVMVFIPTTKH